MAMRHHTKDKGDLAVAKVQADLIERGAGVLVPFTEHAPFDLVAYMDEAFYRVQVKYRTAKQGRVDVLFKSSWADRHGTHHVPMPRNEVDVIAIYCPNTAQTYYINPHDFRSSVTVRIEPSRNRQSVGILPGSACVTFPPATSLGARVSRPDDSNVA